MVLRRRLGCGNSNCPRRTGDSGRLLCPSGGFPGTIASSSSSSSSPPGGTFSCSGGSVWGGPAETSCCLAPTAIIRRALAGPGLLFGTDIMRSLMACMFRSLRCFCICCFSCVSGPLMEANRVVVSEKLEIGTGPAGAVGDSAVGALVEVVVPTPRALDACCCWRVLLPPALPVLLVGPAVDGPGLLFLPLPATVRSPPLAPPGGEASLLSPSSSGACVSDGDTGASTCAVGIVVACGDVGRLVE